MRLTNVAHMRLPFGRLMGYDVSVSSPGPELALSFDQRRHVGAGDRPGSWMALSFRLDDPVEPEHLAAAWLAVIARHGTLRTVATAGPDGVPELHEVEVGPGRWVEHPIAPGQAVHEALRDVLDESCSPFSRPSHRLCVLETAAGPTVVVAADHAHVDMWSMLVIARDLQAALADARAGRAADPRQGGVLPPPFSEHTREMAERPAAPEEVRERWAEILRASGDVMPRFPLSLGPIEVQPERVEVRDVFDADDTASFSAQARADGVSTLSLAVVAMTAVTRDLAGSPLRAVFPVHSRYDATWHDSVGWFITNSVLESATPEPAAAAAAVREAVRLGSWPLEDVLRPWGGMPEVPGMFAISWLDLRRLPVRVDPAASDAQYVGATTRTDGVMLWFILDEHGLHLRCRYPDTREAREHVGAWLDGLVARMQRIAGSSAGGALPVGERRLRIGRAGLADLPGLTALLAEHVGAGVDDAGIEALVRDRTRLLALVRAEDERIVGSMQLFVRPDLMLGGRPRLRLDGLHVAAAEDADALVAAMLDWAHEYGRGRGATVSQIVGGAIPTGPGAPSPEVFARAGYDPTAATLAREL